MERYKANLRLFDSKKPDINVDIEKIKEDALAQARAEVAAEVQSIRDEAAAIKGQAQGELKKMSDRIAGTEAAVVDSVEEYLEQRVPVMLFKDGEKYKDDVVLGLNGEKVIIQRGKQVWIKRKFAHILENQYRQQMVSADMQTKLADEYVAASASRGIQI